MDYEDWKVMREIEMEERRQKEIEERRTWMAPVPEPMPVKAIPGSRTPYSNKEIEVTSSGIYLEQVFPESTSPGLALGLVADAIQTLGKKKIKMVRVYFDE